MKQVLCFDWLPEWARWDCQCWSQASKEFGAANLYNLLFLLQLECSILVIVNLSNDLTFNLSNEKLSLTFTVGFLSQHSKVNKSWTWVWYSSSSTVFWLYVESFIDQAFSLFGQDGWLFTSSSFCIFYGPRCSSYPDFTLGQ